MSVLPPGYRGGTTLTPRVTSYEDLSERIQRQLGAPLINLEVADEQIYDYITDSIEYFTKWAGYTEEYLIFDSRLYTPGVGIKVDVLVNKTDELTRKVKPISTQTTKVTACCEIPSLSAEWDSANPALSGCSDTKEDDQDYDFDLASYRKVVDCFSFDRGEDTGINTLFTLEQAMAQSIYSSYMVGNFGFDLITWEVLKGFIDTRDKVLAMTPQFLFDPRTQIFKIIPEPRETHSFYGVVGCYVERPIKDLIRERWVQKYALALTKIGISRTREKYTGTNLMGGGSINYAGLLAEGLKEKETLEQELMNSYQDTAPARFFIGVLTALAVPAFLFAQNLLNTFC
jgi:hypothetical protein